MGRHLGARGAWPRGCAWLRHELEVAMDRYWAAALPADRADRVQRPKLLLLSHYAGPELGRRAGYVCEHCLALATTTRTNSASPPPN